MKLVWCTDIHLNMVRHKDTVRRFTDSIVARQVDGLIVCGDIAEGPTLVRFLKQLQEMTQTEIYFVLGNHDFYGRRIAPVREDAIELTIRYPSLFHYLPAVGVMPLVAGEIAIVGHDGWTDGRAGTYWKSKVWLNDYLAIGDFVNMPRSQVYDKLNALGDESAAYAKKVLTHAFDVDNYKRVVFVTHVPPYRQAATHEGKMSDDEWAPFFVNRIMGETLNEIMRARPEKELLVLCGHTHGGSVYCPALNIEVYTGAATYGAPEVQLEDIP